MHRRVYASRQLILPLTCCAVLCCAVLCSVLRRHRLLLGAGAAGRNRDGPGGAAGEAGKACWRRRQGAQGIWQLQGTPLRYADTGG